MTNQFRTTRIHLIFFMLVNSCFLGINGNEIYAAAYYFDNYSGSDENPGSIELPFKTLQTVKELKLKAGDYLYFARGTSYYGCAEIRVERTEDDAGGYTDKPLIITAYGEGEMPRFTNPEFGNHFGNAFYVASDYVILDGLYFHDGPAVPEGVPSNEGVRKTGAVYIAKGSENVTVRNCEFFNCPIGVFSYGRHCLITYNYFHDCTNWLQHPYWGAIAMFIETSNHEISYNRIENYVSWGGAFGADGGAIELDGFEPKENIEIHHNISIGNEGFLEFFDRQVDIRNVYVHHNISEDYQQFIFLWHGRDVLIENNTVLCLRPMNSKSRTVFVLRRGNVHNITIRNNIFVTKDSLQVFGLGGVHPWPQDFNQVHTHNLFWSVDNSTDDPSGSPLQEGERIADPMFVDMENMNLRLKPGSPAIDAGAHLGYPMDFENKRIPQGKAPEIGAYEYVGSTNEEK